MARRSSNTLFSDLPKRERQIVDVLYQLGEGTVTDVIAQLPAPPSYSAVRATLRVLEDKGVVKHRVDGPRYVYIPALSPNKAAGAAVKHLVTTFFAGSAEQAVMALLEATDVELKDEELDRLANRIRESRKNGR
jgi:predicted transcriptional regulator